jgi:hypothetical protein
VPGRPAGLASHLELDATRFRDALYETVSVRDLACCTCWSRVAIRMNLARSVLLIDQYRSDAGADPQQVQIHRYQIRPDAQMIELTPSEPRPGFSLDPGPVRTPGDITAAPSQLWALDGLLSGHPLYSQARNDGQLEGTKVGMTLIPW